MLRYLSSARRQAVFQLGFKILLTEAAQPASG